MSFGRLCGVRRQSPEGTRHRFGLARVCRLIRRFNGSARKWRWSHSGVASAFGGFATALHIQTFPRARYCPIPACFLIFSTSTLFMYARMLTHCSCQP